MSRHDPDRAARDMWLGFVHAQVESAIATAAWWSRQMHDETTEVELTARVVGSTVAEADIVLKRAGQVLGGFSL